MQPTDSFSISRRSLDVEDYIDILRRHKGWIFGPFLLCLVASVVGVYLWPDSYLSEARIKITMQQVPESLVPASIQQQMFDRIESMKANILSRSVLTTIIQNKSLYRKDLTRMPMDDVVEDMRKHILVAPLSSVSSNRIIPAFAIQFSYENKYLAQSVVADLMSRFIEDNVRNTTNQTVQTTQFIKDEADQAKKELDEVETRLADFQMQNNGRLPDQADGNVRSLMALEAQLTSFNASMSRANSEKLQMESALQILRDQQRDYRKQAAELPVIQATPASVQRNERLAEAEREVNQYEDGLRIERQRHGETHPDVQTLNGRLAIARQKRDDLKKEDEAKKEEAKKEEAAKRETKVETDIAKTNPALWRDLADRDGRIKQYGAQIEAKNLEIQELKGEIKRTSEGIKIMEGRLNSAPLGAKTYTDLLRDREMAKLKYVDLNEKLDKAQRSQNMTVRNQGEHLEVLDTASLPTDPTEPKRPIVISIGAAIGLLLGVVIAGAREMKDTSLKNLKDVRAYTQMAVLGSIPLLENDFVVKRRRRLAWLGWTTACLVAVVVMVGAMVYYFSTKGGVQ
jgi:succinoglycan biosynthesis transport protein ExoP